MASAKQLAANRVNAALSTGPRTAAGKRASRANAARHGLLAKLPVLAALGETAEAWAAFRAAVLDDLAPVGEVQAALAERVALLLWRLRRCAVADAAAAAVAFMPCAALETPPSAPDPDAGRVKALRAQLADARSRAGALRRAAELADRLADAPADEAVDAGVTEGLWAAALTALRMDADYWGEHLAGEFVRAVGPAEPGSAPGKPFCGWTVGRLRAGLAYLAAGKGPVAELAASLPGWARHLAGKQERRVCEFEAGVAEAEGRRVAARVGPALESAAGGWAALELVGRYETTAGRELARSLTLYFALRAAGPTPAAGVVEGEEVD